MQATASGDTEVVRLQSTSRPLTAEEIANYASASKASEQSIPTLNDFLQRIFTLNAAALLGGWFIVAKGDVLPYWWGVVVLATLTVSLLIALYGLIPTEGNFDRLTLAGLAAYRDWEVRIIQRKKRAMQRAAIALGLAFVVGVIGMATKGPPKPDDPKPITVIIQPKTPAP